MKKRHKNPVARVINQYNKPATHRDRTKYYKKDKHKGRKFDPYFLAKYFYDLLQKRPYGRCLVAMGLF